MRDLLRSGFFRYTHSSVFKVCTALCIAFAALFSYRLYRAVELNEFTFMFASVTFAVLITFSVGYETSVCIRNKIPTGCTRSQVYFSELILANLFILFYFILFLIFALALNFRLLPHIPVKLALAAVFGFLCMALLFANVFAALTCIISSKTAPVTVCLVLIIAMFLTSETLADMLDQSEFYKVGHADNGGEMEFYLVENPDYVHEPWRSILTFYRDANPYGQRWEYGDILLPFLYDDLDWEQAKEATANTIGNDFLRRETSEDEWAYLNRTPFAMLAPIPFFIIGGWFVFRKRSFK